MISTAFLAGVLAAGSAAAAPVDRYFQVTLTVDGQQDWKNALQWSKATTKQKYEFGTGLRSDGKMWGGNLNDPVQDRRLEVKTEYLRQKGMEQLKAAGLDPKAPDLQQKITDRAQHESFACNGNPDCISAVGMKYSTLMAAVVEPDNSAVMGGDPVYQFYFGYKGCPNKVHIVQSSDTSGETAYGRNKDHIYPYSLKTSADTQGSPGDLAAMCDHTTIVVDTKLQKMFVDNFYVPAAPGHIVRTEFGSTKQTDTDLPVPPQVLEWANDQLREGPLSGNVNATVPLTMPLDGNSTVMGSFTGEAKVNLTWGFAPPAGK